MRREPQRGKFLQDISAASSIEEAMRMAGLNYSTELVEVYTQEGKPAGYALQRYDDGVPGHILANGVTQKYNKVDNMDTFDVPSRVFDEGYNFEMGGPYGNGEIAIMTLRGPDVQIAGDDYFPALAMMAFHDGKSANNCHPFIERYFCSNQVTAMAKNARGGVSFSHKSDLRRKLMEWELLLNMVKGRISGFSDYAEELLKFEMPKEKVEFAATLLFPVDEGMSRIVEQRTKDNQTKLLAEWHREDLENFRETGWGFIQAVSGFESHMESQRKMKDEKAFYGRRFVNAFQKPTLVEQAIQLVKVNEKKIQISI